jgi:hypothetical protein
MRRFCFFLMVVLTGLVAGCAKKNATGPVLSSTERTETVRYNKRDYSVRFKFDDSRKAYDVSVKRRKNPMTASSKERNNAVQAGISTVSYFSCPKGYRGRVVPGSASYGGNNTWNLAARCALQG